MRAKTLHPRQSTSRCSKREIEAAASLQSTPHPLDFIAPRGQLPGRRPRAHPAPPRRPHGRLPQRYGQVPRLGARGRPVPQHRGRSGGRAQASPPRAARRGRRGRARASARRREPCDRPQQPDASWWSSRPGSGRGIEGRLFSRPRASGRDFDEGAVERPGRPREAPDLFPVQMREDPGEPPGLRPAVQPGGEGVPGAKAGRQPAPFAALRGDRQDGVEHLAMGETDMAALHRERGRDPVVVSLREVHTTRIT